MTIQFTPMGVFPLGMAPSDERKGLRLVEICGRTAYKSEDKINDESARSFVLMLKKHGHLSVLEHSNLVLRIEREDAEASQAPPLREFRDALLKSLGKRMAYHQVVPLGKARSLDSFVIAGNYRGWVETLDHLRQANALHCSFLERHLNRSHPSLFEAGDPGAGALPYKASLLSEDEQMSILKQDPATDLPVFVFKFICDRGITHEVVRHRVFSFTQESTRYVNYKNKGMTLILPEELDPFYDTERGEFREKSPVVQSWLDRAEAIFSWYLKDIERGLRPEIARDILPNLLKSEILVSGRWSGWRHFIHLRDSPQAHPRIRAVARAVRQHFDSLGLSSD